MNHSQRLDALAVILAQTADKWQLRIPEMPSLSTADTKVLAELFRIRLDWWQGNLTTAQAAEKLNLLQQGQLV